MSKKSLFDGVPDPIFSSEDEEQQSPVATENGEQPEFDPIDNPDSFEDTEQTVTNWPLALGDSSPLDMSVYDGSLYFFRGGTTLLKYSRTGTKDASGNITINVHDIPIPTGLGLVRPVARRRIRGFAFSGCKIYIYTNWAIRIGEPNFGSIALITRHSINGSYEATVGYYEYANNSESTISSTYRTPMEIQGSNIFLAREFVIIVLNLSNASLVRKINARSNYRFYTVLANGTYIITTERIVTPGDDHDVRVFNRTTYAEDTSIGADYVPSEVNWFAAARYQNDVYGAAQSANTQYVNRVFVQSNYFSCPGPKLTITWLGATYNSTTDRVSSLVRSTEAITNFPTTGIAVRRVGSNTDLTGWTHTIRDIFPRQPDGPVDFRNQKTFGISTIPPRATNGTFRLLIKTNGLTSSFGSVPPSNIFSPQFTIDNRRDDEVATITIGGGNYDPSTRRISWTAFVVGADDTELGRFDSADTSLTNSVSDGTTFTPSETVSRTPAGGLSFRILTSQIPTGRIGTMSVTVRANALGADTNKAVTSSCVSYDSRVITPPDEPPSITIGSGVYDPTTRQITWFAYVTSGSDTELGSFTSADTSLTNSVSDGTAFTPSETVVRTPSGGSSFRIRTSQIPIDRVGTMSVTIRANALGTSTNKSVTSGCVAYDSRTGIPTVNLTIDSGFFCPTSRRITWTVFASNATPAQFAALDTADITVEDSGTATPALNGTEVIENRSTNSLQVSVTVPTGRMGNARLTIRANAMGTDTNPTITSSCVNYDTRAATVATASWGTPSTQTGENAVLQARLTFAGTTLVNDIDPGDFDVITTGGNVHPRSGWTFQVSHSYISGSRAYVDVTAIPNATFNASFGLRLKATSVRSGGSETQNAPASNVDSALITFDNRPSITPAEPPSISIGGGNYNESTSIITWTAFITNASNDELMAFTAADTSLSNSVSDGTTFTPTVTVTRTPAGGSSFRIQSSVIPTGRTGTMSVSIVANALGANTNKAVTSGCVYYDSRVTETPVTPPPTPAEEPPSVTMDSGLYDSSTRRVTWIAFVTGASDTELTAFMSDDASLNNIVSDGTTFTPTVTVTRIATGASFRVQTSIIPVDKVGDISVTIRANALGDSTNRAITSGCVNYDTRAAGTPTVATASWGTPASMAGVNAALQGRLTFGGTIPVTGIDPGDFDVILEVDGKNEVHPRAGWTFQVSHDNVTSTRRYVDVTAIPNETFAHSFGLRLNENSVRSDGSATDNAPADNVDSTIIAFDNRDTAADVEPQVIIGTGSFCPGSRKISWPVSVINATSTQFDALDTDDITITDSNTATPALMEAIVSKGTNSLIVEITVPVNRNGTASITVRANALGASTNPVATSNSVSYDTRTTVSTTTVTFQTPVVTNANRQIQFPMTFSDIGEGLEVDDFSISVTNGTWSGVVNDGATPAEKIFIVTNSEPFDRMGSMTITLDETAFTNRTITGNRTSPAASYNLESTIETTTITYSSPTVTNNNRTITYRLTFSNIGAGLSNDNFTVSATNGTWDPSFEYLGNDRILLTLVETTNVARSGSLTVTIDEDAFFNRTITGNRTSGSATYNLTTTPTLPTVTISIDRTAPVRFGERFNLYFTWDRDVTGFTADDIFIVPFDAEFGDSEIFGFYGSGRQYRMALRLFDFNAPNYADVRIQSNAVDGGNNSAVFRFNVGAASVPIRPTIIQTAIDGVGMTYTPDALYTIDQADAENRARIRSYSHTASLLTNNQATYQDDLDLTQDKHATAIEILDNRFLVTAKSGDNFGVSQATGYIENSRVFNKFFIDAGDMVEHFQFLTPITPEESFQRNLDILSSRRAGQTTSLALQSQAAARAFARGSRFELLPIEQQTIGTPTAILDLAVGINRVYLLVSGGSVEDPQYNVQIYDLFGTPVNTINVDISEQDTIEYASQPASLAATERFLYLGFDHLRDPLAGNPISGDLLFAYTLDGERQIDEDIRIATVSGVIDGDYRYGIESMDWDETNSTMWMIMKRTTILDGTIVRWFANLDFIEPINASFDAIGPQIMQDGGTFDLKPYASNTSSIQFAQIDVPTWLTLSNGVLRIATSGLPSTNTTVPVSFIGIGSGNPAFVSFDITLLRAAPTWRPI